MQAAILRIGTEPFRHQEPQLGGECNARDDLRRRHRRATPARGRPVQVLEFLNPTMISPTLRDVGRPGSNSTGDTVGPMLYTELQALAGPMATTRPIQLLAIQLQSTT
jgi:hypothetical protein